MPASPEERGRLSPPFRVLLVSLGKLNGLLLQVLARTPGVDEVVVATRDTARAEPIVNLARVSAGAQGYFPSLRAVRCDLNETDRAAEIWSAIEPKVTLAAPSLQSWWVLDRIPAEAAAPLRPAGFGVWLPFQLLPALRFMTAWRASGLRTPVITAPYPDVVNAVLATRRLAPTCGVGNLDEIVPKIRWRVAAAVSTPPEDVSVWLVGHHALERFAYRATITGEEPPPFLLRVEVAGKRWGTEAELRSCLLDPYPLARGLDFHFLTVGSAVHLIRALGPGRDEPTRLHVPGPQGLPGGYPVLVREGDVELDLPADWSLSDARRVNEASHRWDGIEAIEVDGSVRFTAESVEILRRVLGLELARVSLDELEDVADALKRRFEDYVRGFPGAEVS